VSYLLDTNVCIAAVNGRPTQVRHRLGEMARNQAALHVSVLSVFEIEFGLRKSDRETETREQYDQLFAKLNKVPFDEDDAAAAGAIRAELESSGRSIGAYDYLIASQALRRNWTLVTANEREFSRVKGLKTENWAR
jgi:tRNA(fMet)-specific endonuclease VapC